MSKTQLLNQFAKDQEQRSFFASALDKLEQAQLRHSLQGTGFFTGEEQVDFLALLEKYGASHWEMSGGYGTAERKVMLFPPEWMEEIPAEEIPLTVIEGTVKGAIGHRDVLGSLMGLGLNRRKIGDIILEERQCQVVVLQEVAEILLSQWSSVGRYAISLVEKPLGDLVVPEQKTKEITSTVASLRLDSLVATGFSLARSKAVSYIAGGRVAVNHRECQKPDKTVAEGDLLTCRGLGKCQVMLVKGQSKKGRWIVVMERYL